MKRKTKAAPKYMHTLDQKPATFTDHADYGPYMYYVGGRNRVVLVDTLAQIRREQRKVIRHYAGIPNQIEWADPKRYGYVLVQTQEGQ